MYFFLVCLVKNGLKKRFYQSFGLLILLFASLCRNSEKHTGVNNQRDGAGELKGGQVDQGGRDVPESQHKVRRGHNPGGRLRLLLN